MSRAQKTVGRSLARCSERYEKILHRLERYDVSDVRFDAIAEAYFTRGGRWPKQPASEPRDLILRDLERAHRRAHDLWDARACAHFTLGSEIVCSSESIFVQAIVEAAERVREEFARAVDSAENDWVDPERPEMDRDQVFQTLEYLMEDEKNFHRSADAEWSRIRGRLTQKDIVFAMLVKERERTLAAGRRREAALVPESVLQAAHRRFKSELSMRRAARRRSKKVP